MNEIIIYKNLDWYVMKETDTEKLLILKNSFSREQSLKYFNYRLVGDNGKVMFNTENKTAWCGDSPVREGLNDLFLIELNKDNLANKELDEKMLKERIIEMIWKLNNKIETQE